MPGFRLLARGALAAGPVALLLAASAPAERPARDDQSPVARTSFGLGAVGALQHDGTDRHLPPVRRNLELVGRLELTGRFGNVLPEQIADVAVHKNHAYLNSWNTPAPCDRGGTYVVDIANPAAPREIGFLPALAQNYHGEGAHVITMDTPAFRGDVLAVNNEPCTGTTPTRGGGMDLWDVTNPASPQPLVQGFGDFGPEGSLVGTDTAANSSHSVFMWTTGAKAYAVQVDNTELTDVDVFDITNPRSPQPVGDFDLTALFPQTLSGSALNGTVLHHDMVVEPIDGRWVLLASYWDAGYIKVDVTDPANPVYMADSDFGGADPLTGFDPPEGNAHQAEFSADNRYIVTGEEDFAAGRITQASVDGVGTFPATAVGGGAPLALLPDGVLNGPMAYGGYGCPASPAVPAADTVIPPGTLQPGEEQILILQRGPTGDTDEDYNGNGDLTDDACFPGEKAASAGDAGWDAVLLTNRHFGSAADDEAYCGSGGYDRPVVTACTTHEALHEIFDDAPEYGLPYNDTAELVPVGTVSPHKLNVTETFDGWGYMSLYGATPGADGKLPLLDTYAIPEALQPTYASGFGDLSIHEHAADPTEPLSYSSYYSGGVRVFSFAGGQIAELGAFIDEGGSNFWGVEQFTTANGERLIAASDRDYGLYILRYTGPGAAQRPVCTNTVVAVPFKGSANVPLGCGDANGNPLTRTVTAGPASGTLAAIDQAAGTVRYTHTGDVLGTDALTFTASDGAATAAPVTATLNVGARDGGRCFNGIRGTGGGERILGSAFGDSIRAGAGADTVRAGTGVDCAFGQEGGDRVLGGGGADEVNGGSGADRVYGEDGADHARGGGGDDDVRGGEGDDIALGDGGDDDVRGGDGDDTVFGGSGDDRTDGGDGADQMNGRGGGADRMSGGTGRDRMDGGDGADRIAGGNGRDRIVGGDGNDRLFAGGGRGNRIYAGRGDDRVSSRNGLRDRVSCGRGTDRVVADRKDRVRRDCERVAR